MRFVNNSVEDLKIAYVGGGSRGWAWGLMSDLAQESHMSGDVYLYDIDYLAAKNNEIIGNKIRGNFKYHATETIDKALLNANFVIISILPGTLDEMESDVHTPEKFGIYQSVGDSTGLGGNVRGLRTLPMFQEFAKAIEKNCPDAWVINYTNPMTMCVRMLYETFPKIKAFGCCHEVFGTQNLLKNILENKLNVGEINRSDIKVEVTGINHFTWLTKAQYRNIDIYPLFKEYAEEILLKEVSEDDHSGDNWINKLFKTSNKVKCDLFLRYGKIAAAGDRHLSEFCPNNWYLGCPENVDKWAFALTPVSFRKQELDERLKKSEDLISGKLDFQINPTGEEGVAQIKAILGLGDLTTNVNLPNMGQIPNIPLGAVVETNAFFSANNVSPIFAGDIPCDILGLIEPVVCCQETMIKAAKNRDLKLAFKAFLGDPQNILNIEQSKELFMLMLKNTEKYLSMYELDNFKL